jgi:hypothetical protein
VPSIRQLEFLTTVKTEVPLMVKNVFLKLESSLEPVCMTDSPEGDLIMDRAFRDKIGPMAFRLALGLVCLIHGFSKIRIGGGTGWNPALATHWQMAISWGELVCGILVIIGMQCRPAAAGLFLILLSESVLQYQC